jgi:hypothetical protein
VIEQLLAVVGGEGDERFGRRRPGAEGGEEAPELGVVVGEAPRIEPPKFGADRRSSIRCLPRKRSQKPGVQEKRWTGAPSPRSTVSSKLCPGRGEAGGAKVPTRVSAPITGRTRSTIVFPLCIRSVPSTRASPAGRTGRTAAPSTPISADSKARSTATRPRGAVSKGRGTSRGSVSAKEPRSRPAARIRTGVPAGAPSWKSITRVRAARSRLTTSRRALPPAVTGESTIRPPARQGVHPVRNRLPSVAGGRATSCRSTSTSGARSPSTRGRTGPDGRPGPHPAARARIRRTRDGRIAAFIAGPSFLPSHLS